MLSVKFDFYFPGPGLQVSLGGALSRAPCVAPLRAEGTL